MPRENLKFKRVEIMNKSKFLKKSLAMLLALMLVLAMIPLSASAAQTDYINYPVSYTHLDVYKRQTSKTTWTSSKAD